MSNTLQIKRGIKSNLPILNSGEFGFCTDKKEVYIGDGISNYQILLHNLVTTKGDILAASSNSVIDRLGVGTNNQILIADDSVTTGLKWINIKTILDPSYKNIIEVTDSSYNVLSTNDVIKLNGSLNIVNAVLPTAIGIEGKIYIFKCIDDTNSCSFSTTFSQTIDGVSLPIDMIKQEVIWVQSDGSNWIII